MTPPDRDDMPADLPPELIARFETLFVRTRYRFLRQYTRVDEWHQAPMPLTSEWVTKHLQGEIWAATKMYVYRKPADYIVIDIDRMGADDGPDIVGRMEMVRDAGVPPSFAVRSSKDGGVHVYTRLSEGVSPFDLVDGVRGRLLRAGVVVKGGYIEVLPTPKRYIRLPFGLGSCLVTEDLHELSHDLQASLDLIEDHFPAFAPGDVFTPDDVRYYKGLPPEKRRETADLRQDAEALPLASGSHWRDWMEELLANGLQEPSTRNAAIMDLARYHSWLGYECEEAIDILKNWLSTKHNGNSQDYNTNPGACLRKIEGTVRDCYAYARARGYVGLGQARRRPNEWFVSITREDAMKLGAIVRVNWNLLLLLANEFPKDMKTEEIFKRLRESPETALVTQKMRGKPHKDKEFPCAYGMVMKLARFLHNLLLYAKRWKDDDGVFVLPRDKGIRTFADLSPQMSIRFVDYAVAAGLLKLHKEYNRFENEARMYEILFHYSESGEAASENNTAAHILALVVQMHEQDIEGGSYAPTEAEIAATLDDPIFVAFRNALEAGDDGHDQE